MAPLKHSNLVHLYGAVWNEGPDKLCLVLEYVPGGSLLELLITSMTQATSAHYSPFDAEAWASPRFGLAHGIAKCFNYLHHGQLKEPILHRDLKPANVLVDFEMRAKANILQRVPLDW